MAYTRDISNHTESVDRILGLASQTCILSEKQKDISGEPESSKGDGGSFDCNICQQLAHDPVVTICGHLFCWPCLYQWLHLHSTSQECPACKAFVTPDTVVPLYGRGNSGYSDERKKSFRELNVPQRPAGRRPRVARPHASPSPRPYLNNVAGPLSPAATGRPDNFSLSAGFGFFPVLFGLQVRDAFDAIGSGPGYPFGWPIGWREAELSTHQHGAHMAALVIPLLLLVVVLLVPLCTLIM